jgi:hypothetical protein
MAMLVDGDGDDGSLHISRMKVAFPEEIQS